MHYLETELSVEELSDRWSYLRDEMGIEELQVTENFIKNGIHTFTVRGLMMEIDDEIVTCDDKDKKLIEVRSVLMMFLRTQLKSIKLLFKEGITQELIEFNDGFVVIELV
jgi:hypothetical protein